jgi:hypothetical protein
MKPESELDVNQAAYRRLKDSIRDHYPRGRFVALAGGQIVYDADTFSEVFKEVTARGLRPTDVLVVQAGMEHPEYADILLSGGRP